MSFRADTSPSSKALTWFGANNKVIRKKIPLAWESWKSDILRLCLICCEPDRKNVDRKTLIEKPFSIFIAKLTGQSFAFAFVTENSRGNKRRGGSSWVFLAFRG